MRHLILLLAEKGLVGMNELQVGGGGDVHVAPLLSQEALAQGLDALVEQHTQLRHLCAHLQPCSHKPHQETAVIS